MIIASVLLIFLLGQGEGRTVVITKAGETLASFDIQKDTVFDAGSNVINIENGEVYISKASCDNKICMQQGRISLANQTLVCAPNGICVSIKGEGDIDAFTQ